LPSAVPDFKEPFHSSHDLYADEADYSLRAHRSVVCEQEIIITDWWQELRGTKQEYATCWNYTCAVDIAAQPCEQGVRLIHTSGEQIFLLSDDLVFEITDGWMSTAYGTKYRCKQLRAKKVVGAGKRCTTLIKR
jgi:hypothetical protein